jgi:hypothetical protein
MLVKSVTLGPYLYVLKRLRVEGKFVQVGLVSGWPFGECGAVSRGFGLRLRCFAVEVFGFTAGGLFQA